MSILYVNCSSYEDSQYYDKIIMIESSAWHGLFLRLPLKLFTCNPVRIILASNMQKFDLLQMLSCAMVVCCRIGAHLSNATVSINKTARLDGGKIFIANVCARCGAIIGAAKLRQLQFSP